MRRQGIRARATSPYARGIFCLALQFIAPALGGAESSVVKAVKDARSSVVAIVVPFVTEGKYDGRFIIAGTGFAVTADEIATAAHVVGNEKEVLFLMPEDVEASISSGTLQDSALYGRRVAPIYQCKSLAVFRQAKLISSNAAADVAKLKVVGATLVALPARPANEVEAGSEGIVLGFPFGYNRLTVHKVLISFKGKIDGIDKFQLDGIVNRGNSGGPLVDLESGKAIGVVHAKEGNVGPYLKEIMSTPQQGGSLEMQVGAFSLDIQKFASEVSAAVDKHIQMGIGYASFNSYL